MLALMVVGGALGGSVGALAALVGPKAALVAVAMLVGAGVGAIGFLGFDTHRAFRQLTNTIRENAKAAGQLATGEQVASLQASVLDARNWLHGDVSQLGIRTADDVRQLEAMLNLHAMIKVAAPLPPSRGWAASPDLLLAYVGEILSHKPDLVVECGSGLSTLWAALALETIGGQGRVVALEHDAAYGEQTRVTLARHGVAHRADVRHAPIGEVELPGGRAQPWYDLAAAADLDGIGVLLVDGPIGALGPQARYPAMPLLRDRMAAGAVVILDDASRPEEQEVLKHWLADQPELRCQTLNLEKGAAVIRLPDVG
jgi:predicted O-methyltransferase YrrM